MTGKRTRSVPAEAKPRSSRQKRAIPKTRARQVADQHGGDDPAEPELDVNGPKTEAGGPEQEDTESLRAHETRDESTPENGPGVAANADSEAAPGAGGSDGPEGPGLQVGTPMEPAGDASTDAPEPQPASPSDAGNAPSPPSPEEILAARLSPDHRKLIDASAIWPEVAVERGYRTIRIKAELEELGFAKYQRRVPTLLVPIRNVAGELVTYQARPNDARINKSGKPVKYETPTGSRNVLDVPLRIRSLLRDPSIPLVFTEGARKADAAVSIGIPCIALIGVFGWRGTNAQGGKASLPDWDAIALNGRKVYLAFDSDVTVKPGVALALRRLKEFLELHEAKVKIIYLPDGPDGEKVGLDDYLAAGHGLEDLLALSRDELPPEPKQEEKEKEEKLLAPEYRTYGGGLVYVRYDSEGEEQLLPLTNFTASITTIVIHDDGVNTQLSFEIFAHWLQRKSSIEVPANEFSHMNWVAEKLGAKAIVYAGIGTRDHTRTAIQVLSGEVAQRRVYTHTGWRCIEERWVYLHASGAVSATGSLKDVHVRLPDALAPFELPDPPTGEALIAAVRASMQILDLAPDRVSIPVFAAIWASVLSDADFSIHLSGTTGVFKTQIAALAQQHFGVKFETSRLPGSWSSTENALEAIAFAAMNALFVIDDFVPRGGASDTARLHRTADRILRGQGNQLGRQRLNADGTLRPTFWPRGLILSTGEDIPEGQSLRARMMAIEVANGDIPSDKLTLCQQAAREGLYALAMSGFLSRIAPRKPQCDAMVRRRSLELRAKVTEAHRRTAHVAGHLMAAMEIFLGFAVEIGALLPGEQDYLLERTWDGLMAAIDAQSSIQQASEPTSVFLTCLRSAMNAGEAHLEDQFGNLTFPR